MPSEKHTLDSATRELTRLHNRHYARLMSRLQGIEIPQIALDFIANELAMYTNDVRENIFGIDPDKSLYGKNKEGGK